MEEKESKAIVLEQGRSIYSSLELFEMAQRMAKSLAACDFVPDKYRGHVPNCLIAIDVANRFGNWKSAPSPLAVMQNLYVVHGKPGFEGKFVIALINTCGHFSPMRWEFFGQEGTPSYGAIAVAKDLRSGEVLKSTPITLEMAEKEGWLYKQDKNRNELVTKWQTMAPQMLRYRSASFWLKAYAPELLMGMSMTDELEDQEDVMVATAEVISEDDRDDLDVLADKLMAEANETTE